MSRIAVSCVLTALLVGIVSAAAAGEESPKVIKITAKRFVYTPSEITLKKGQTVILELTSEDRVHGFDIPGMHIRTDVPPGKVTDLKITPQKSGDFDFFCDIFCGSGHENMEGKITVTD